MSAERSRARSGTPALDQCTPSRRAALTQRAENRSSARDREREDRPLRTRHRLPKRSLSDGAIRTSHDERVERQDRHFNDHGSVEARSTSPVNSHEIAEPEAQLALTRARCLHPLLNKVGDCRADGGHRAECWGPDGGRYRSRSTATPLLVVDMPGSFAGSRGEMSRNRWKEAGIHLS
jgi:hypothetical protein